MPLTLAIYLMVIGDTRNEYVIDMPAWDIARRINLDDLGPASGFIGQTLPEVQRTLPRCEVTVYAIPTGPDRLYRIRLHVLESVGHRRVRGVLYEVMITPEGQRTRIQSRIDLQVVGRCRLIQRFVGMAERAVLRRSEATLRAFATKGE